MSALLTIAEVAERLACSTRHARRLVQTEGILHTRVGRVIRVSPEAFEVWLARRMTTGDEARATTKPRRVRRKGKATTVLSPIRPRSPG